jgi:hypothetical protein
VKPNSNPIQLAQTQPAEQGGRVNPLTELRDLHEPEPVSTWPPAPGWWLLALLILAGLILLTVKALKYNRKRAYRREASHQLMLAREHYRSSGDGSAYAQALLEILKRTALTAYPRDSKRIASLHGEDWLKFLDSTCSTCNFRSPEGRGLLQAAYSAEADAFALQQCYSEARLWIAGHRTYGGQLRA